MDSKFKYCLLALAVVCVTALDIVAMVALHEDGKFLIGAASIIAGIAGYAFGYYPKFVQQKSKPLEKGVTDATKTS